MENINVFVDREKELRVIVNALMEGRSIWIRGEYGIGKTTLLRELQHKIPSLSNFKKYKNTLYFLMEGGVQSDTEFFDELAISLGINEYKSPDDIVNFAHNQPDLLILDEFTEIFTDPNFSDSFFNILSTLVRDTQFQIVISSGNLTPLKITSNNTRADLVARFENTFVCVDLKPFSHAAARKFLDYFTDGRNIKLDDNVLEEVIEVTGGVPRALGILINLICEKYPELTWNNTINEYKERMDQSISRIETPGSTKQYTITDDALEKHAATDKPVQNIRQDKLDFKIYVNALHSFILSKYTTTPLTISIDGVWGTGKSSLMSMLKEKLDPKRNWTRKFYEWCWRLLPRLKWYGRFWGSVLPKAYGKVLIALTVRNDLEDPDIHLYIGDKVQSFKKHVSDIVKGFAVDPEFLNRDDDHPTDENIIWWAQVNANCEPMEPPYHYTVWLNAWKFDKQEEVWASLALATMEQIKQKHGLSWRLRFWLELTFKRFSFWSGLWQVIKQFLLPLLFGVVAAFYNVIIGSFEKPVVALAKYGGPLLWAGCVISGILVVASIFKDPFQIPLDKVFDRPNYKDKVSFLAHFEKDFARIVRAATKNGFGWKPSKLIIFIDDLDRCEPPKSADIVEAINLFLDAEGCVFVVGMDSESVAMSIEVKYKELFERMKAENAGVISLGRLFLDKIVQIPFSVPRATSQQITSMVNDAIGTPVSLFVNDPSGSGLKITSLITSGAPVNTEGTNTAKSLHASQVPGSLFKTDPASYAKPEVRAAILKGTELLADNPRQVKTFINLFRLSIYIANERKILEEKITGNQTSGLNLEKLAIWTACSIRWQSLLRHLHTDAQVTTLRNFLHSLSSNIQPDYTWVELSTIHDEIKTDYKKLRDEEKGAESHWCYLPWEWWLLEPDFLKTIKSIQDLWTPPSNGEIDWLMVLLTMSRPIMQ